MATLEEGRHAGEFIVSEANGHRSRLQATVLADEVLEAGHVVGRVTATNKLREWNPANNDGSEAVFGVAFAKVDATGADKQGVVLVRDCEVNGAELVYFDGATEGNIETATLALEGLGIIAR